MKHLTCIGIVLLSTPVLQADWMVRIPPVAITLHIEDQPVGITVAGSLSAVRSSEGSEAVRLKLDADLSDLQRQITPILQAQLHQDNRCGDRLSVQEATLSPDAPAGSLQASVHYEKWGCAKAFGKQIVKRLIAGDGVIRMRLTPVVENADTVRLQAEVRSIDADGGLGEILRAGTLGVALQDKIRKTVVSAVEKSANLTGTLPAKAQGIAAIRSVQFSNGEEGHLWLNVIAEVQMTPQQAQDLADQLKWR